MDGPAQGKAAFSAFHIKTFGEKRWKKLYRALRQPTSHVALVNPYVPAQWIAKELARLRAVPVTALPEAFMKDMPVYALPDAPASPEQQELYNIDEDARWPGELPRVGSMPGDMQYFTALSGEDVPGPHVFGGLFGRVGWYLLDAASLCAPLVLNPQPGEKVLDVCAAPGGKSLVMSYLLYARAELAASKSGVAAAMKRWAEHESLQLRLGFAPDAAAAAASAATAAAAAPTKAASDDSENEVFPASRDGFFEPTWVLSDEDPAAQSPGPLLTVTDSQSMARKGAGTGVDVTVTGLGGVAKPTVITAASAAVVGAKAALGTNPTINPAIVPGAVAKGAAFSAVAKEAAAAKAAAKAASSAKAADGEAAPVSTPLEEEVRDDDSVVVFAPDAPAPAPISAAAVAAAAAATGDAIPELVPADATAADLPASSVPAPAAAPAGGNGASEIKGEGGHVTLAAATAAAAEASAAAHAAAAANYQAARLTAGEGAKVARRSKLVLNDVSRSRTERLRQVVRDYLPFSLMPSVDVVNIDATTVTSFGAVTYSGSGKQQLASASAAAGGKADKGSTAVAALPPAGEFDCVLLDAPCSSDRHVVHDPEALAHWTTQVTRTQAKRQISLLDTSVRALKVGGRCVYSTCSLSPLENDGAVAAVLKKYPGMLKVVKFKLPIGEATKLGWILLPDQPGCVWGPLYICYLHRIA